MTIFEGNRPLLDAFRRGEREALRKVYVRYVNDVFSFIRRGFTLSGPPPVRVAGVDDANRAQDSTQEVFTRAFGERARQSYDGLRLYRPFLLRIARNLRIDEVRAQKRETLTFDEHEEPAAEEPAQSREEDAHWDGLAKHAREYIAELDDESRRYIQARFVDELSQAEVAEAMGITRRRVRTLERDVQAGLKRFLQKRGVK